MKSVIGSKRGYVGNSPLSIASAYGLFFVLGAATSGLGAAIPLFEQRFDLAASAGGVIVAYNFGAFFAAAYIAWRGSKLVPVAALSGLIGIYCLGSGFMFLSTGWSTFLIASTIAGIGYGGLVLLLNTAFAQGFGDRSVVLVSWLNATFGLGAICGPVIAGYLGKSDVQSLYLIASVAILACFECRKIGFLIDSQQASGGSRPHVGDLNLGLIPFLLIGLLYAGLETSIGAWFSTNLMASGWHPNAASSSVAYFWLGIALGRFCLPPITRHLTPGTSVVTQLTAGTLVLFVAFLPNASIWCYPLAGFLIGPVLPTLFTWATKISIIPQRLTAMLMIASMSGNVIVPALVERLSSNEVANSSNLVLFCVALTAMIMAIAATGSKSARVK